VVLPLSCLFLPSRGSLISWSSHYPVYFYPLYVPRLPTSSKDSSITHFVKKGDTFQNPRLSIVTDRPSSDPPRTRRAAKRLRHRRNRLARRHLDEAYAQYLDGLRSRNNRNNNTNNNIDNNTETAPPPPPPQPVIQPPSPVRVPTPPSRPCTPPPDSPHSVLTLRVRPDTPPRTPSLSPPSYSPIHSPRPSSPTNSTSSVEFIDEFYIPSPRPRHYYHYDPHEPIDTLITQFPQHTDPLPPGAYTIGPDDFDLAEIREIIATQPPDYLILTYLPNSPFPYNVPVRFFYNLFPPSTVRINELQN